MTTQNIANCVALHGHREVSGCFISWQNLLPHVQSVAFISNSPNFSETSNFIGALQCTIPELHPKNPKFAGFSCQNSGVTGPTTTRTTQRPHSEVVVWS